MSSDDEFRNHFSTDPLSALLSIGYQLPSGRESEVQFLPWFGCFLTGTLASKAEIAETRTLIRSFVTSAGNHTVVFALEAGRIEERLGKFR